MDHPFMVAVAVELARRRVATLRYQFPYMQRGARRPDPPQLAQATVRAAVDTARALLPNYSLIAGGKSFGGRMTSHAQAKAPLQGVWGLALLGFPLHPAGRPSQDRAAHLFDMQIPMLFLQGTRDTLASPDQLEPLCKKLGSRAMPKAVCGRRSLLSCAGADRAERCASSWRRDRCAYRVARRGDRATWEKIPLLFSLSWKFCGAASGRPPHMPDSRNKFSVP
jgi:hypothetical protein